MTLKKSILLSVCLLSAIVLSILPIEPAEAGDIISETIWVKQDTFQIDGVTYRNMTNVEPTTTGASLSYSHSCPVSSSWKLYYRSAYALTDVTKLNHSTWTVKYRYRVHSSVGVTVTMQLSIDIWIVHSNGTTRQVRGSDVANSGSFGIKGNTGWVTKTGSWECSEYTVVDQTDYLVIRWQARVVSSSCGFMAYMRINDNSTSHGSDKVCQIQNFAYETSSPPSVYYFDFNHTDIDSNTVDTRITWQLHNASGQVSYNEGEATLTSGAYTLKTYRHGILINETSLDTSTQGNSTVNASLPMKAHSHTSNGYITSNATISSITMNSQTAINLTFTISGATPALLIIDVAGEPDNATKDGSPFTNYTYYTSPAKYVRTEASSFSTFSFTWDQPPEEDTGDIPSSGAVGGNPWNIKLWVTVYYQGEILHMANVSIENSRTLWKLTDIFGMSKFRLPKGTYKVRASHEDYGSAERDVLLEDHMEIDMDIAKGSPLSVFPSFDFGEFEFSVLALPVAIFVIYAFSLALRKPKRKYRYSYLG